MIEAYLILQVVIELNRKIIVIFVALMAVAMLATPVMAIGPQNAEDNPHVKFPPYGVSLATPSGIVNEWVNSDPVTKHFMWIDAREFNVKAFEVTDISQVSQNENKWLFFSMETYEAWMIFVGLPGNIAHSVASHYPEGVYYREVIVGK